MAVSNGDPAIPSAGNRLAGSMILAGGLAPRPDRTAGLSLEAGFLEGVRRPVDFENMG
jgi:hypothetical protein